MAAFDNQQHLLGPTNALISAVSNLALFAVFVDADLPHVQPVIIIVRPDEMISQIIGR